MSVAREKLQEALCQYITDTLIDINTVKEFCEINEWVNERNIELNMFMDIKVKADKIDLSIGHVTHSESKGKALGEYMMSKVTQVTADSRREELEQELAGVLKDTLGGLEKLDCFLDAVERLAVTSLHVFSEENRVLHLPQEISPVTVQVVIKAAREVCPLLLEFKRDAKAFFLPKLQNVEVLEYKLKKYIQTAQKICDELKKSSFSESHLSVNMETVVDLGEDFSEDDIQRMLRHINELNKIRIDQHFRMLFLFEKDSCCRFISEFDDRQPRMQQFLNDLEECAVHLYSMNKGATISSVAGSSVGAVGGILSIIGLALSPLTAGTSLLLTVTGLGLGITSGVNSAVTTATEIGVNYVYQKKASKAFQSFMEDVQSLQDCLDEVSSQTVTNTEVSMTDVAVGVGEVTLSIVDTASAINDTLKSKELVAGVGKVVTQEGVALHNVVSDIPDIGQAAVKGPLALTKTAMFFDALFLGMDFFFICYGSISLAKGSETEVSKFIRARAALWSSEMNSWQKIHDSLSQGLLTSEKKRATLETPFEPEMEIKTDEETKIELPSDEVDENCDDSFTGRDAHFLLNLYKEKKV
ncbi:uncharacterized protein LOC128379315 [Scomber japonicus]|uniref:uncharacterized protein LOC128379315 n=1 Tax=Scomber japonicus TaxID=13676 RepID=UPI0023063061|nr:uncharacterized protein LOC128379315 [Scomber japonicus]